MPDARLQRTRDAYREDYQRAVLQRFQQTLKSQFNRKYQHDFIGAVDFAKIPDYAKGAKAD